MRDTINAQQPLKPLYVIHGEEDLLRIETLDQLRVVAKQQGYLNREVWTVDSQFDWQEMLQSAASMGLFAELKLLELHIPSGKPNKAGAEALQQLAANLPPDTVCVVMLPKLERAVIQSKWFTALAKVGEVVEAKAISLAALPAWIEKRLGQHHLTIDQDALALFAEKVEGNLLAAKQEIDKLALLHSKGSSITLADAEAAVANVARFDVFQLSSAWMSGDSARVAKLLEGLEADGGEPVLLLWTVAEDVRMLIRLTAALKQGQNPASLRQSLRLWGDKQTLAPQAARRIGINRLLKALQDCAMIDRMIKGAESGEVWPAFRQLVIRLASDAVH